MDQLLATAVANWGPRFTANGVDPADYERITHGLERWDDWCDTWSREALVHQELGDVALTAGFERSAGEAYARASVYFHFAKFLFVHDLDQARRAHEQAVALLTKALSMLEPSGTRHEIPFEGSRLVGILRTPDEDRPMATVILIPGLDSTKEEFREVERTFLDRGLATFSLDGPGQGEVEYDLPIRPDWEVVGEAVVNYLTTLVEVDAGRIGVWGVSLGGYYAARVAAAGLPIRATVALSGPFDFGDAWPNLNPLTQRAFMVRSFSANEREAELAARTLSLEGVASRITAPLLTIMGQRDRLFSWREGERLTSKASGPAEFLLLEDGNHGCANVVYRHRPYAADWLASHLRAPQPTPAIKSSRS